MNIFRHTISNNSHSRAGQSLIEVMVAITVLTVSFLGISTLLAQSLVLNRVTANQLTATYLASEGIEIAKNLIDHDVYLSESGSPSASFGTCFTDQGNPENIEIDYTTVNCSGLPVYNSSHYLYYAPATGLYGYDQTNAQKTNFTREVSADTSYDGNGHPDEITVSSTVNWVGLDGTPGSVNLEDHFYPWNTTTTP